jgi:hypothetical protein
VLRLTISHLCVRYVCWVDYLPDSRWERIQNFPFLYTLYLWADRHQ